MKLNNLIKSNHWLSVQLTLLQLYPGQEAMVDDYRNVFEKLKCLVPEDYDMNIVLNEYDRDPDDESEIRTYVDVSGRKDEGISDSITNSYALEFVEWKKWLGMDLASETITNFSELEIIAHCLYEMTFVDYNEDEIKEQFNAINDRIEEYKNLTEKEKKEKTLTLDELKKRFGRNSSF